MLKVFVVCEDADRVRSFLHVNPSLFECRDDFQQLLVVDRIIEFCRGKLPAVEVDGVQVPCM